MIKWLNMIGFMHQQGISEKETQIGICQNQDYFLISYNPDTTSEVKSIKMVFDGCGGNPNSGVGAQLFAQLFNMIPDIDKFNINLFEHNVGSVIEKLKNLLDNDKKLISNNLYHTILCVFELSDMFIVKIAGDGYIILCKQDEVEFIKMDNGEFAEYYLYNFLPIERRGIYKDGVTFKTFSYSKTDFTKVGVATDGFEFANKIPYEEQVKLKKHLLNGNFAQVQMLINRNYKLYCNDDITICM